MNIHTVHLFILYMCLWSALFQFVPASLYNFVSCLFTISTFPTINNWDVCLWCVIIFFYCIFWWMMVNVSCVHYSGIGRLRFLYEQKEQNARQFMTKFPNKGWTKSRLLLKLRQAPLTLRGQRGRWRNIKGEPQIYGRFPTPKPRPLFCWVWFYGGPWQTQAVCIIWSPLCKY